MRIVLGIEYDGSRYHGWQAQAGLHTVQSSVEKALSRIANHTVEVVCAGRTDTGVHALGQVVHFDTGSERSHHAWIYGSNTFLPKDIAIRWVKEVPDDFHARYSAVSRSYRYVIYNHSLKPALLRSNVAWHYKALDHERMAEAGSYLIGEYDFTSFRASECQSKTPIRHLTALSVTRQGDYVIMDISANAFLHHMIRNIAGVLIAVGAGLKDVLWAKYVLEAKDRRLGGETAPAYGLYFMEAKYPDHYGIAEMQNPRRLF